MAQFDHHSHRQNHTAPSHSDASSPTQPADAIGTPPTPPTAPGALPSPSFSDIGMSFDDATRAMVGGLWQSDTNEGGQGHGSVFRYVGDLQSVQAGLVSEMNAGQFTGETLLHVQDILLDVDKATSAATASVNGGGSFGSVAAAEEVLRMSHLDILDIVHGDATLSALATQNGATAFQAAPAALADGLTAATAPHATLADLGAIFNDAVNHSLGGINANNAGLISADIDAVRSGLETLIAQHPDTFSDLTGIYADTIVRQLNLEDIYIHQAGSDPLAARGTNDNFLDIIDIVQGDSTLAGMASHDGVTGFASLPDALAPTPKYMDNAAQTDFWANFIAQSNSLGQQAIEAVQSTGGAGANDLIGKLHAFQNEVTHFDSSQGGIFEARFDNELLGKTSTLGAEVSKMIEGLQTGDAALVSAAAEEMHTNAADVGGNNIPLNGGTYNVDGLTAAEVLPGSTSAHPMSANAGAVASDGVDAPQHVVPGATPAPASADLHDIMAGAAARPEQAVEHPAAADFHATGANDHHHTPEIHFNQHIWI